jgi:hypothetical protein
MAGERKGKTYEAITYAALQLLKERGQFTDSIYWNKKPSGMSIEPDLTIGPDEHSPAFLILITQSGSARNSDMKSWRNLGELFESKTALPVSPTVLSVVFDAVIKEELKKVQASAFDGQLIVGDRPYGAGLQHWVDDHINDLPLNAYAKSADILRLYKSGTDPELAEHLNAFLSDLSQLLRARNEPLDDLWFNVRQRPSRSSRAAKITSMRRGSAKLLVVSDIEPYWRCSRGELVQSSAFEPVGFALGYLRKMGVGAAEVAQIKDDEITDFLLSAESIEDARAILSSVDAAAISPWVEALRESSQIKFAIDYVNEEVDSLAKPEELYARLARLGADPAALVEDKSPPADWPPRMVWLYVAVVALLGASSNSATGFGYSAIATSARQNLPAINSFLGSIGLSPVTLRGQDLIRRTLQDWVNRRSRGASLSPPMLGLVSWVLSDFLRQARVRGLPQAEQIIERHRIAYLEQRLIPYKGFEPLAVLLKAALPHAQRVAIRSCFAEAAGLGGEAGKTTLLQSKGTLINWQSVSDAGRDHKKKELCGRAVALRYHWNASRKQFEPRPGVKKLILVLDGTWRQADLDALVRAGWDEIYYPDEMSKLAKTII